MPSSKLITAPMKAALLECFLSAVYLLPHKLRSSFILVGGAASVLHGSEYDTKDVDVAASEEAILYFYDAIASNDGTTRFKCQGPLQEIEFHCSQDFVVQLELLQFGGGFVDLITKYEPLLDGYVASREDLFVLRSVAVADRGRNDDLLDFEFLLRAIAERGLLLPQLEEQSMQALRMAAGKLSPADALILSGILREDDFVNFSKSS